MLLHSLRKFCSHHHNQLTTQCRYLTTTEVSTALRPFYFTVHPDLFGQFPNERTTNENSLKQLSAIIESLQAKRPIKATNLQFYVRNKTYNNNNSREATFRLIKIVIKERDIRQAVLAILKSCNLSTAYIDAIPKPPSRINKSTRITFDFSQVDESDPIFGPLTTVKRKINDARDAVRLHSWLTRNYKVAVAKADANIPLREEVDKLQTALTKQLALMEIRWDCGWNVTHYRGCLQSFMSLAQQHPETMHILKGRTLVFAPFTGISLDGHIMLNSGEVRHNWLDLIKNVKKYDATLLRIPGFERSVSQVLRNIRVGRRKFMPKILAGDYEKNLQQITTALSDYRGTKGFPKDWPESLANYEIVVETEAGPLMVSPTGQFIVPSSLPGLLLVSFISKHLEEAGEKIKTYELDKHVERALHRQCLDELQLSVLRKDDNITPDVMIKCCEMLLANKNELRGCMSGLCLNIATYYSVLSDGMVCIPWNWKL